MGTYSLVMEEVHSRKQLYYHDWSGRIPGHTTRAPPVGFELETNGVQLYAIANLDKTGFRLGVPATHKPPVLSFTPSQPKHNALVYFIGKLSAGI